MYNSNPRFSRQYWLRLLTFTAIVSLVASLGLLVYFVHLQVTAQWRDRVIEQVTDDERRLQTWREILDEWIGKGWNPRNVLGMLDMFSQRAGSITKASKAPSTPPQNIPAKLAENWNTIPDSTRAFVLKNPHRAAQALNVLIAQNIIQA